MNTNRLAVCKENITAFVRRFRLLERKLEDNSVPTYPEESCVIKLLDGLRLDERATAQLLLAAGNKFEMRAILDAIKIQYPAGMSVAGLPNSMHGKKGLNLRFPVAARSLRDATGTPMVRMTMRPTMTMMRLPCPTCRKRPMRMKMNRTKSMSRTMTMWFYDEGTAFAATLTLLDGLGNSMWPMPRIQHLNYTAEQLDELRQEHRLALQEMATTIMELKKVPPWRILGHRVLGAR